jgi:hypothetical protein
MLAYRLDGMKQYAVAFDLETHIMQPGLLAPPIVLGSASELGPNGVQGVLLDKAGARAVFRTLLDNPYVVVCVANGAYDFLCMAVDAGNAGVDIMPKIFDMYDPKRTVIQGHCDGRVFEVLLAEPLHAIAQGHRGEHRTGEPILSDTGRAGRYKLRTIVKEVLDREDAKVNDQFRLMYAQFDGMPLENLPFEARQYPVDDTNNTLEAALAQAGHLPSANTHEWIRTQLSETLMCRFCNAPNLPETSLACMRVQRRRNLDGLALQSYFAWAAHLGAAWGFHVNQEMVDELEAAVLEMKDDSITPFRDAGIVREDGTENQGVLKRLVAAAYGARDLCAACNGTGKVPSPKTNGKTKINCAQCDGTSLALPRSVPRAEKGGVKKDADTLQESANELLIAYGDQPSKKLLSTYIPLMRKGRACNVCGWTGMATKHKAAHQEWCTAPNGEAGYRNVPICPDVDPLKETERAAIGEGIHGLPRKGIILPRTGKKLDVRSCWEARRGFVYSSEDYTAGELVTLAWNCIKMVGWSRLAEYLNTGKDAHLALAGTMLGKSYEEMERLKKAHDPIAIDTRQATKAANFGFGGGMAEVTFVIKKRSDPDCFTPCPNGPTENAKGVRGYDGLRPCILIGGYDRCGYVLVHEWKDKPTPAPLCKHCLEGAAQLREFWFKQWPEMKEYFAKVKAMIKNDGPSGTPEIVYQDGLVRGGMSFTDASNGFFQRTLAKAAKASFCQIQREFCDRTVRVESSQFVKSQFAGGPSPLANAGRAIVLFHDETIAEHVESVAHEGAHRVSEIMVDGLCHQCPELAPAVKADPTLMRRLLKGAEPRWLRGGVKKADENDRLVPYEG